MSSDFIQFDDFFDHFEFDDTSRVFQIFPKVFNDDRGSFTEVMKQYDNIADEQDKAIIPYWFAGIHWMKQINRSTSVPNVCRGMHAQKGAACQSKLVECISGSIHDIIIDARPNSKTYGRVNVYYLDSVKANKLFVPTGFLHGFYSDATSQNGKTVKQNIFQYYIGGDIYRHENEFSVSISDVIKELRKDPSNTWLANENDIILSDKDKDAFPLEKWLSETFEEYKQSGVLWYK